MTNIYNYNEYCDNGCSGGSCITCDDTLIPTGQYECRSGYSYELYESECGSSDWRRGGSACCNDTAYPGGTAYATGCTCQGAGVPYQGYPTGYFCLGSTSEANSYTEGIRDDNKAAAEKAAKCGDTYSNEEIWISKQKTNCPSNCTPKGSVSYKVSANSVSKTYCSQSAANDAARSQYDSNAQSYANNQSADTYCDCPDPECSMDVRVSIDGWEPSGVPHINFTVSWDGNGYCSDYQRTGTVYIYCGGSQIYSTSLTIRGESGSWSSSANYTSGCDPSTAYGSFS